MAERYGLQGESGEDGRPPGPVGGYPPAPAQFFHSQDVWPPNNPYGQAPFQQSNIPAPPQLQRYTQLPSLGPGDLRRPSAFNAQPIRRFLGLPQPQYSYGDRPPQPPAPPPRAPTPPSVPLQPLPSPLTAAQQPTAPQPYAGRQQPTSAEESPSPELTAPASSIQIATDSGDQVNNQPVDDDPEPSPSSLAEPSGSSESPFEVAKEISKAAERQPPLTQSNFMPDSPQAGPSISSSPGSPNEKKDGDVEVIEDMKPPETPEVERHRAVTLRPLPPGSPSSIQGVAPPVGRNPLASLIPKTAVSGSDAKDSTPQISPDSPFIPPVTQPEYRSNTSRVSKPHTKIETTFNSLDTISTKPTCSLNLVCYRSGTKGCEIRQIRVALQSRFKDDEAFQGALEEDPELVVTDVEFLGRLREVYLKEMCGVWRRAFFLKTLRGIRLLSFTPTSRPTVVPLDDFVLQEVLYAYRNPSKIDTEHEWIDWVFRLRQPDRRHALEFVEGWNGTRIAVAGTIPWLLSTLVGIIWSVRGGDVQTAFTVAGFILTSGTRERISI